MKNIITISIFISFGLVSNVHAACREPIIPIHMFVITDSNGVGNDHWKTDQYTDEMMIYLNSEMYNTSSVELKILKKMIVKSTNDYHTAQKKLASKYNDFSEQGVITVVIAREEKIDVSGHADGVFFSMHPFFSMRSQHFNPNPHSPEYVYKPSSIRQSALLFIHELGHQMDLVHSDSWKVRNGVHADNYTWVANGKVHYENYFKKLYKAGEEYRKKNKIIENCGNLKMQVSEVQLHELKKRGAVGFFRHIFARVKDIF